jgi:hypothetical protein
MYFKNTIKLLVKPVKSVVAIKNFNVKTLFSGDFKALHTLQIENTFFPNFKFAIFLKTQSQTSIFFICFALSLKIALFSFSP